jgi:hypothetical protein
MRALIAAAALALGVTLLAPAPAANAAGVLTHGADAGYNRAFYAWSTATGGWVSIAEGQSASVYAVYVFDGQEIWCYYSGSGWQKWVDATGQHDMGGSSRHCVSQAD